MKNFSLFLFLEKHPNVKRVYAIVLIPVMLVALLLFVMKSIVFGILKQIFVTMPQEIKFTFSDVADFYTRCVFGSGSMSALKDNEMSDMHEYY